MSFCVFSYDEKAEYCAPIDLNDLGAFKFLDNY
jgi:hypothetical protein